MTRPPTCPAVRTRYFARSETTGQKPAKSRVRRGRADDGAHKLSLRHGHHARRNLYGRRSRVILSRSRGRTAAAQMGVRFYGRASRSPGERDYEHITTGQAQRYYTYADETAFLRASTDFSIRTIAWIEAARSQRRRTEDLLMPQHPFSDGKTHDRRWIWCELSRLVKHR